MMVIKISLGNRWIVTLYTATAHKQPPLDLSELEDVKIEFPNKYPVSLCNFYQQIS